MATRGRPAALSGLLASLAGQSYGDWSLLLLPNGAIEQDRRLCTTTKRYLAWLNANGVECNVIDMGNIGRSPAVAFNRAMVEADREDIVLVLDDDMWIAPDYIEHMVESFIQLEQSHDDPVVLSGVTPWMDAAWEGIGPHVTSRPLDEATAVIQLLGFADWFDTKTRSFEIIALQNTSYGLAGSKESQLRPSHAISPANFMLRPELKIPWSDVGHPFVYADLAWSLQARSLLNYQIWFDLRCEAWHVNDSGGGLRLGEGNFDKEGPGKEAQGRRVERLLQTTDRDK